ncbi:MAG: hypothetical protein PHE83_05790 [Opitutaceae bacterium]|nr:hypothetical protein [Opitutaceae bacterium]
MKTLKITLLALACALIAATGALHRYLYLQVRVLQSDLAAERTCAENFCRITEQLLADSQATREKTEKLMAEQNEHYNKLAKLAREMAAELGQRDRLAAQKAEDDRIASAAYVTRGNYQPADSRPAPAPRYSPAPALPAGPSMDAIRAAAERRADTYFRYDYRPGSSATLSIDVRIDLEEPEPMPGWPGQYHVRGIGRLSFFDSKGISFGNATEKFEVTVITAGGALRTEHFTLK